jgi:PAS domain S-box-containing protein
MLKTYTGMNNYTKYQNMSPKILFTKKWQSFAILIIGIVLTLAAAIYTKKDSETVAKHEFALVCNEIKTKITTRLYTHAQLLRSGSALFAASDEVTRKVWKLFVENSRLNKNIPGIQGVGFSVIIKKELLQQHIQQINNEGFPDYTVRPAGNRDIYTSIIYLEPFADRNLRAFGYDMFSEPIRRKAMEQARDYDVAALSGKVILVQETNKDVQAGTLMYVPVYRNGLPINSIEERQTAIIGWVYSPYRMVDMMQGILGSRDLNDNNKIHLQVFDNDSISQNSLLFDSQSTDTISHTDKSIENRIIPIEFNGKKWTLKFTKSNGQSAYFQSKVLIVLFSGFLISLLLFSLSLSLLNTRFRAQQIAEKLTKELKESEEMFAAFMDNLPASAFIKDTYGRNLFFNRYLIDMMGFENWGNKLNSDLITVDEAVRVSDDDKKAMESGVNKLEETMKDCNGNYRTFETIKFPIRISENVVLLGGIAIDITERKRAEVLLKESELKFKTVADYAYDWEFWTSPEKVFIYISPSCEQITGYKPDDFKNNSDLLNQIIHIDDLIVFHKHEDFVKDVHACNEIDFRITTKQGEIRWINHICQPVFDENANYIGIRGSNRDITDRKKAEEALQESEIELSELNASKDKFFSIIGHDLNSPFNSILGLSELLVEQIKNKDIEGIDLYGNLILKLSNKAMDLLMNLMEWSRSQTGRMEFNPEYFDMVACINKITLLYDDIAGQKSITIKNVLPHKTFVFADNAMISTVVRNLISNAVKYTMPGGEIIVSVMEKQSEIIFSVSDSGVGIPQNSIDKLFRIDQSFSTTGTNKETGTGLGLILCKDFVEKHNGKIWVESKQGKGSTVYFTLPYNAEPQNKNSIEDAVLAATENQDNSAVSGLKILIAEDDKTSEMLLDIEVKTFCKEILKVRTGIEAVEACRNNPDIDLILMDIQMPEMNGYEATRQIRVFNKEVVIIAQTAIVLTGTIEKSIEAGCNDYISKPVNKDQLLALIQKYFKK